MADTAAETKPPLYPMSDEVRALYDANWHGDNVKAVQHLYQQDKPQDWLDEVVQATHFDVAASEDLVAHDGSGWPNHPVYSHRGGYGGAFVQVWRRHEPKIRQFLGAKRPSFYTAFKKDDPNKVDDPAQIFNKLAIAEQLQAADKAEWANIKGIRMTDLPWGAYVVTVADVRPHGDTLSIVTTSEGNEVIANKREDGSFRWEAGEPCVYVPEGAIVPDDVLQERGYWDADKGKGLLEGKKGNRVKMRRMAGFESRGLLFKVGLPETPWFGDEKHPEDKAFWIDRGDLNLFVNLDDNVTDFFGITEHVAQ